MNAFARIAEIDEAFESAAGWGSWMIMVANEREDIVNELRSQGIDIAHKYQARDSRGNRVED